MEAAIRDDQSKRLDTTEENAAAKDTEQVKNNDRPGCLSFLQHDFTTLDIGGHVPIHRNIFEVGCQVSSFYQQIGADADVEKAKRYRTKQL